MTPAHESVEPGALEAFIDFLREGAEAKVVSPDLRTVELAGELAEWWLLQSLDEIYPTVAKAVEYSSTDLRDIGRVLADVSGWAPINDAQATELGIAFYVLGKLSRVFGAYKNHRLPSDDTWFDIGVYARMAQRTRQTGGWPK